MEENVLRVRRVHVTYHLEGPISHENRVKVERVLGFHADKCPVARSIRDSIDITTEVDYVS